jgi:hypothetical protein
MIMDSEIYSWLQQSSPAAIMLYDLFLGFYSHYIKKAQTHLFIIIINLLWPLIILR